MDKQVIACALDAGNLKERLAWIANLNAKSLKSSTRDGLTLVLDYDRSAAEDVRAMVASEQSCCSFLDFDVTEHPDLVRISIAASEEARDAAEALFEPFAARIIGPDHAKPCGCNTECGA